jgi:hypothetical protein
MVFDGIRKIGEKVMTKAEIIEELWENGEVWANQSYTKKQLEIYLMKMREAQAMTEEKLRDAIRRKERNF